MSLPLRRFRRSTKCCARRGISSLRSLSGGKREPENLNPVIQILAKLSLFKHGPDILIRSCKHPYIGSLGLSASQRLKTFVLEYPQEADLKCRTDISYFIQKDSPSIGLSKPTGLVTGGAGEGPGFVPEQFRFQERVRNGSAIYDHQGLGPSA